MDKTQERYEDETLEEYFFRMLVDKQVDFNSINKAYVAYLEKQKKEYWHDIVEGTTLVMATYGAIEKAKKRAITWGGDRKSLKERCKQFINKYKIFNEVE